MMVVHGGWGDGGGGGREGGGVYRHPDTQENIHRDTSI